MDRKFVREALVVGVNNYPFLKKEEWGDLNLKAPVKDAEAIANILEKYGKFRVKRLPKENDEEGEERLSPEGLIKIDDLQQAIIHLFKPHTKEETPDVDVTKEEDDTTWSIFQFLKNVIKMPKLLGSGSNFV